MMHKKILLMLFVSLAMPIAMEASGNNSRCQTNLNCDTKACSCPCSGKTYFSNRPLFHSYRGEFIAGFRNDRMIAAEDGWGGALDIVPFGGQSNDGYGLASYFLPFCKNPLRVSETLAAPTSTAAADLLAQNFNIFTIGGSTAPGDATPFASTVRFCARHDEFGVGLHLKRGFAFCETDCGKKWWYIDIAMPITQVRNIITINETITSDGGGVNHSPETSGSPLAQPNMVAAFNQQAWNYGKIASGAFLAKTAIADIELKFARQWLWREDFNMASYIGILIPTGNRPCGQYVFEPIVGHGGHAGIIWGGEGTMDMWADCEHIKSVQLGVAAQMQYLFNRKQVRSFDVKNRPWSRYIPVYLNEAQAALAATSVANSYINTPGINVFTQCVNVVPGLQVNGTTALIVNGDNGFQGELGYNFYAHHQECVSLAQPWQVGPAFISTDNYGTFPAGITNPYRTITNDANLNGVSGAACLDNALAAYSDSLIQEADLDLESAAHPYYFSHTIHTNLGKYWNEQCYPTYFGVGGSYEFAINQYAAMNRWTVWGKFNVSF